MVRVMDYFEYIKMDLRLSSDNISRVKHWKPGVYCTNVGHINHLLLYLMFGRNPI
jgi:hypothetical protein